jgi:hypothetical protein
MVVDTIGIINDKARAIISEGENKSTQTCIECGKKEEKSIIRYDLVWYLPLCDECYQKKLENKK